MQPVTISQLKRDAAGGRIEGAIHCQIESISRKETREQKPYWEVTVADAEGRLTLRAWSDSPTFSLCADLRKGAFLEITGEFAPNPPYGLDAKRWNCRTLTDSERETLLRGPTALREKQDADFDYLLRAASALRDPRLRALCSSYLSEYGDRLRRTAAARNYHHSRRGGLVEHTAQMMRAAEAVAAVYPALNKDLLLAGVLFHDAGKLWENAFSENGFLMPYSERGELVGHITIGMDLVNRLWRQAQENSATAAEWTALSPASEDVRMHLLHLIAAHHGSKEFGSPVEPKTPEAFVLNQVDNMDAKLEMILSAYETATPLAARVYERTRPLPGNLVEPLPAFSGGKED